MSNENRKVTTLRIDQEVMARVKEQAKIDKRSTGNEVEYILEQYLLKTCTTQ